MSRKTRRRPERRRLQRGPCFNGAATRVSRKTVLAVDSASTARRGFNGAATRVSRKTPVAFDSSAIDPGMLQWGRDEGVAEDYRAQSRTIRPGIDASMGPRRGCRGRPDRRPTLASGRLRSFNGAATRVSRKTRTAPAGGTFIALGFNGAATRVSRKTRSSSPRRRNNTRASMGPRRGCRGRLRTLEAWSPDVGSLQWGRDEGVAEDANHSASAVAPADHASMGPRRGCRGRPGEGRPAQVPLHASMGPRRGCRGRQPPLIRAAQLMLLLQWGRDEGVAEDAQATALALATATALQWGRDEGVAEDEASPMKPRIVVNASMGPRRGCRGRRAATSSSSGCMPASMGPRRGCRGRRRDPRRSMDQYASFNGAATRVSRKTRLRVGHIDRLRVASMGPRRGCRGRRNQVDAEKRPPAELQWGRDEGVAEDSADSSRPTPAPWLQWGRDEGVAEDGPSSVVEGIASSLQWGRDEGVAEDGQPSNPRDDNRLRIAPREVTLCEASMGTRLDDRVTEVSIGVYVRTREKGAGIRFVLTSGLSKTFRANPGKLLISPPFRSREVLQGEDTGNPDQGEAG